MAAAPLNPQFAPAVRYAKVPLVGSVVGEAPSLDGCRACWAVGGDALATPPANGVVLLETPDLTRPFDSKQFGFVVLAGDDGSEERLREIKNLLATRLQCKEPLEMSIGFVRSDAFPCLFLEATAVYVGFIGCKMSFREEKKTVPTRRVALQDGVEAYFFTPSSSKLKDARAHAVTALLRYSQSTARFAANVQASPITLARNPGLPSPEDENEPAQPPQIPAAGGAGAPAAPAAAAPPNPCIQKRHSQLDVELLRLESLLDPTADTFATYILKAVEYARHKMPSFWLKNCNKLKEQWGEAWQAQDYELPPRLMRPLRAFIGYQRALFLECVKDPFDHERRILDVQGLFGIGKSTWVRQMRCSAFWSAMGMQYPGVMSATLLDDWKSFMQAYKGQRVVIFDFEKGCKAGMPAKQASLIPMLSDPGRSEEASKYKGGEKELCCHVVVIGNEGPHRAYVHKQVWSLVLQHRDEPVAWHFPGEPPSAMADEGALGDIAQPPPLNSEAHTVLEAWRRRDEAEILADPRRLLLRELKGLSAERCRDALQLLRNNGILPGEADGAAPIGGG